jgi:hypothetical protein
VYKPDQALLGKMNDRQVDKINTLMSGSAMNSDARLLEKMVF